MRLYDKSYDKIQLISTQIHVFIVRGCDYMIFRN